MRARRDWLLALGGLLAATGLEGCGGWALRGTRRDVLGKVKRLQVKAPTYGTLYAYFAAELSYINVAIVQDPASADAVVELTNESYERRVLSVDPDTGKVREIEVTLTIGMTVRGADGSLISAPETLRWTEDFVFDEGSLLGTVENETVLRIEMSKVAARALVLKLETVEFNRARAGAPASAGKA